MTNYSSKYRQLLKGIGEFPTVPPQAPISSAEGNTDHKNKKNNGYSIRAVDAG